jgi:hypothetical protein
MTELIDQTSLQGIPKIDRRDKRPNVRTLHWSGYPRLLLARSQ